MTRDRATPPRPGASSSDGVPGAAPPARRAGRVADRLLVGWAAAVALFLLVPPGLLPELGDESPSGLDKAVHVFLFLVLARLAVGPARARSRHPLLLAAVVSAGYGGLLELLQAAGGARTAELGDLAANGLGSCVGVLITLLRRRS